MYFKFPNYQYCIGLVLHFNPLYTIGTLANISEHSLYIPRIIGCNHKLLK